MDIELSCGPTHGKALKDAEEFMIKSGIPPYAVNRSIRGESHPVDVSRKINADLFIDDRNFGGFGGVLSIKN